MSKSLFKAQRDNELVYHMLIKYSRRDWLMEFPNIYLQGFAVMEHVVMKLATYFSVPTVTLVDSEYHTVYVHFSDACKFDKLNLVCSML